MYKLPLIESSPTNGGPPFYFAKAGIHVVVCLAKAFRHIRESATKLSKVYATELELNLRRCVKEVARKRHEHHDSQESLAAIMQTLNMFAYQLRASAGRFPRTAHNSAKFSIAVDRFYASLRAFKSELDYVGNLMQCYHDTAEKVESAVMYAFENATSTTIKKIQREALRSLGVSRAHEWGRLPELQEVKRVITGQPVSDVRRFRIRAGG